MWSSMSLWATLLSLIALNQLYHMSPMLGAGKLSARKIEVILEAFHPGGIGTSALWDV